MTEIKAKVVLCDIEGTTTSISFVKDVLFPYAKSNTKQFLQKTWHTKDTRILVQALLNLPEYEDFQKTNDFYNSSMETTAEIVTQFVNDLIDKDLKVGPLKTLQGHVWAEGYESGSIKGHVYQDVPVAFSRWQEAGICIAIYSSGSVQAQRLLFGNSELGDLRNFFCAHFDTAVGQKQEEHSYREIAKKLDVQCCDIVFLTDIIKEAEAARLAGLQTVILSRPGNAALTDDEKLSFTVVNDFDELQLRLN